MFPSLTNLVPSQPNHPDSRQCSLVQCLYWRTPSLAHFCGTGRYWRSILRWSYRCFCRFHHSHRHPCFCRWQPLPSRPVEPWDIQSAYWNYGLCVRSHHVTDSLFPCVHLISSTNKRTKNPSPVDMNWTCVVYGGPMLMAFLWYIISAHKWFKGPKVFLVEILTNNRSMLNIVCWVTRVMSWKPRDQTLPKMGVSIVRWEERLCKFTDILSKSFRFRNWIFCQIEIALTMK
jgi:hypothetical protein